MQRLWFVFVMLPLVADASAAEPSGVAALMPLLEQSDDAGFQRDILNGLAAGIEGRRDVAMPADWPKLAIKLRTSPNADVRDLTQRLSIQFGDPAVMGSVRKIVRDTKAKPADREQAIKTLAQAKDGELPSLLRGLLSDSAVASAALRGLAAYDDRETPTAILSAYARLSDAAKIDALATLAARPKSAEQLLAAIGDGSVARKDLSSVIIQQLRGLGRPEIDALLTKVWGQARSTSEEKKQEIQRIKDLVQVPLGVTVDLSHGRALYVKTCQQCHTLYGEGNKVGPDITGANRSDLDYLLINILDPSAIVAKDYQMSVLQLTDGRVLSGLISRQDEKTLTLITPTETLTLPKGDIVATKTSELSLMPEDQLTKFSTSDLRDLFAYLRHPQQVPLPKP